MIQYNARSTPRINKTITPNIPPTTPPIRAPSLDPPSFDLSMCQKDGFIDMYVHTYIIIYVLQVCNSYDAGSEFSKYSNYIIFYVLTYVLSIEWIYACMYVHIILLLHI